MPSKKIRAKLSKAGSGRTGRRRQPPTESTEPVRPAPTAPAQPGWAKPAPVHGLACTLCGGGSDVQVYKASELSLRTLDALKVEILVHGTITRAGVTPERARRFLGGLERTRTQNRGDHQFHRSLVRTVRHAYGDQVPLCACCRV
jgi:hypothetical protein